MGPLVNLYRTPDTLGPPFGGAIYCRVVGEPGDTRAVSVHHVDLGVAVRLGEGRVRRASGRPGWLYLCSRVVGEPGDTRAVSVHHVDLEVAVTLGESRGGR